MTPKSPDLKTLRALAEAAPQVWFNDRDDTESSRFYNAASPSVVLSLLARIAELEARLRVADKALEFYADESNWTECNDPKIHDRIKQLDHDLRTTDFCNEYKNYSYYVAGNKARAALRMVRGQREGEKV